MVLELYASDQEQKLSLTIYMVGSGYLTGEKQSSPFDYLCEFISEKQLALKKVTEKYLFQKYHEGNY